MQVYHLGNSLIRGITLPRLAELAQLQGKEYIYGSQLGPGVSLQENWEQTPGKKFNNIQSASFGMYDNALTNYDFDTLVLEPYNRNLYDLQYPNELQIGDVNSVQNFIDFTQANNPETNFYLYSTWPKRASDLNNPGEYLPIDYQTTWDRNYIDGDLYKRTYQTRDYHHQLITIINQQNPELLEPVRMIPVGDVLYELDKSIKNNEIPGLNPEGGVDQFYVDNIHFNPIPHDAATIGTFVTGITVYTTLSQENPLTLSSPATPWELDSEENTELIKALSSVIWNVVSSHPFTGVSYQTITGSNEDDLLKGSSKNDSIFGEQGNDILQGLLGHDTLVGGEGNDSLIGVGGNDSLEGNLGDDTLNAGAGNDTLKGNEGNDLLIGVSGNNFLQGNTGEDLVKGGKQKDTLEGNEGNDFLVGNEDNDLLKGGENNDTLNGMAGDDILFADEGNDRLSGNAGDDILIGTNPTVTNPTSEEFDILIGGTQKDSFVLGNDQGVFYSNQGINDYAIIQDFNQTVDGDRLQLFGTQNDYFLTQATNYVKQSGTAIVLTATDDLIAVIKGEITGLTLDNPAFVYLTNTDQIF